MKLLYSLLVTFVLLSPFQTFATPQQATKQDKLNQEMLKKVENAKVRLAQTETDVSQARAKLALTLNALEREVIALRESTSVARRKNDEKTLGLSQLENRLAQWQEQQVFQENVLNRFLMQEGKKTAELEKLSLFEKVDAVLPIAKTALANQNPAFRQQQVIMKNGELSEGQTLSLGPVTWFVTRQSQQAGLASVTSNHPHPHAQVAFDEDDTERLLDLIETKIGFVTFDPTLGRAATQEQSGQSLQEHVTNGGMWVIPIIAFGLIAVSIALFKVVQLWRLPKVQTVLSSAALQGVLKQSSKNEFVGMQRELIDIAQRTQTTYERDDELFSTLQKFKYKLEKFNGAIAVTAAVAPLLGLLGTVSGMIETFRMMTAFGSSDPEIISGGIAKALVTTELGLVVAIPALILNAVLSRKAKHYYEGLEGFALLLSGDDKAQASASRNPHYTGAPS
ncbi:MotA/TolQ/ExbB proton channel family protein [Alteromonas gracilis]|uniref:MotA/TolQ/ExbB proton channel family protein n=1 Tax=Alteromonas gracilis TaxID=1479524 RepID=UPI0030D26044